jgi:hypothetical protein
MTRITFSLNPTGLALTLASGLLVAGCAELPAAPKPAETGTVAAPPPAISPVTPATQSKDLPDGRKLVSFEGVSFEYDPKLFGDAKGQFVSATPLQSADEKPDGVLPRHRLFTFGATAKGEDATSPYLIPHISVYPIEEFKKVYALSPEMVKGFTEDMAAISAIGNGSGAIGLEKELPYGLFIDAHQSFRAHATRVAFKSGKGFGFLTQYDIEPTLVNNENLVYVLQGVTADGKYYVLAEFHVASPLAAPRPGESHDGYSITNEKGYAAYVAKTAKKLEASPARDFTPNLEKLDELFKSITVAN